MRRFAKDLFKADTKAVEVLLVIWSIVWGAWLILNPTSFDVSPIYRILHVYGDETVWGTLLVLVGILKLLALWSSKVKWKRVAFSVGMMVWAVIDLSLWFAVPASTGGVTYLMPVIASAWVLLTLSD